MNIFQDVLSLIKTEEGQKALPMLATAITNVAGNPTILNAQAQAGLFLAGLITAEIGIGQDALKKVAADVTAAAAAQVVVQPQAAAPAPAPPAWTPPAVKPA